MKKVFLIHGSFGNPKENWFPWLKRQLEDRGYQVMAPKFPTPKGQSLKSWRKVFLEFEEQLDGDTIFVAHSLGPAFVLDILERSSIQVKACFFVSGFLGSLGLSEFDKLNESFTQRKFTFGKIRMNCKKFVLFHSDNDPYVSLEKAEELRVWLGCELNALSGAGHFNKASGYLEFKELLTRILGE